jgi:hypothetical protein
MGDWLLVASTVLESEIVQNLLQIPAIDKASILNALYLYLGFEELV